MRWIVEFEEKNKACVGNVVYSSSASFREDVFVGASVIVVPTAVLKSKGFTHLDFVLGGKVVRSLIL